MTPSDPWPTSALRKREGRADEEKRSIHGRVDTGSCGAVANDNWSAEARVESAVLTLARLLGRQIAREQFVELHAANDNPPAGETGEILEQ